MVTPTRQTPITHPMTRTRSRRPIRYLSESGMPSPERKLKVDEKLIDQRSVFPNNVRQLLKSSVLVILLLGCRPWWQLPGHRQKYLFNFSWGKVQWRQLPEAREQRSQPVFRRDGDCRRCGPGCRCDGLRLISLFVERAGAVDQEPL